jgi:hypothetical protein
VEFLSEVLDNCINVILFIGSEGNRVALRISASAEIEIAKTYSYFEHLFDIDETWVRERYFKDGIRSCCEDK